MRSSSALRVLDAQDGASRFAHFGDDYVPLWIQRTRASTDLPLYWRAIPNDESLLEIAIDSVTHMVSAITLPLVAPSRIREVSTAVVHVPIVREGVPIVDISPWGDDQATRFVDEAREFTVDLGEDGTVSILFGAEHTSVIHSNSVSFLLDADEQLSGLTFVDLPEFVVPALRARRAEPGAGSE